eukprot:CAMPEP_0118722820 /NCGR_PEP_ID=MMETSP0800-20121206/31642_1 /TAXON_ID=210618 ORGANISM="Striatella unipunctata, Strain CCMP2910" /NCGR_SAMPLE_ID=MMETSP0800 /ASSEMBLY_ACC=CAM_ASM_000638 /LENGTH=103 /DNA_ID=CAMNT_0006631141 /DNA_START=103 /DNA_END=414 /DNA_ORIENTATION=-
MARNDQQDFPRTILPFLGATNDQLEELYSYDNSASEILEEIGNATAVWCGDWLGLREYAIDEVFLDAYNAPLITTDPLFSTVTNAVALAEIRGCSSTPGLDIS